LTRAPHWILNLDSGRIGSWWMGGFSVQTNKRDLKAITSDFVL